MTTKELEVFSWQKIAFVEHGSAKIIVLVCKTKDGAEGLYNAMIREGFRFHVSKNSDSGNIGIHLVFSKGEKMGIPETTTVEKYPQLKWLTSQQITHITVGYIDNGKTQLLPHDYIFLEGLLNLN